MLLSPAFTFGLLLATLYGALTHLILGGEVRLLLVYILASWVGFGIGQGIGQVMAIRLLAIGQINVLTATLGSLIALATTVFLSQGRAASRRTR
jgi:hypothetical protein